MREIALKIGTPTPLTAIATDPATFDSSKPAVLILNSGVMHHIGTCRVSVKIARTLAESGLLAVRFDFSGIGDSTARRGQEPFHISSVAEITEVMDYLERKKGIKRFIVYGLCSGADASYEIAQVDERIIGMAQIDAYCYTNTRWFINRYVLRLLKPEMWPRILARVFGLFKKAQKTESVSEENLEMPSYIRIFPPREKVAEGLRKIVNKNIAIYSIFTGDMIEVNHQSQFENVFSDVDFNNLLRVEYYPDLEHIITSPSYQSSIPEKLCQWANAISKQST